MKKVAVIGHYAYGLEYLDGQTIKTKIVTNELCKEYGESEIIQFDTHGGVKTLLKAPVYVWRAMKNTQNIIILPAHNGLRIFGRLPYVVGRTCSTLIDFWDLGAMQTVNGASKHKERTSHR